MTLIESLYMSPTIALQHVHLVLPFFAPPNIFSCRMNLGLAVLGLEAMLTDHSTDAGVFKRVRVIAGVHDKRLAFVEFEDIYAVHGKTFLECPRRSR